MFKRCIKEISSEKGTVIWGCVLIFALLFVIEVNITSKNMYDACIVDAIVWISGVMPITMCILVTLFAAFFSREIGYAERTVRYKHKYDIWSFFFLKTIVLCLIFAVCTFAGTLIVGRMITPVFCNWSDSYSYCYGMSGIIYEKIDYLGLLLIYFLGTYVGFCICAILPILTQWKFNSYIYGAVISIILNVVGKAGGFGYVTRRTITFFNAQHMDIMYMITGPIIVLAVIYVLGICGEKKDFLKIIQKREDE